MLNIRVESVVNQIVRQELVSEDTKTNENLGLYFNIDCRLSHYNNGGAYNVSRGLHLIYHRVLSSSYITVFSGVTASPFANIKSVDSWKHECSHDSCWRDIGVFSEVYFSMAREIDRVMEKDGLKLIAPKDMHESNSFVGFDKIFEWKKVRVTTDPNDDRRYRKLLELL